MMMTKGIWSLVGVAIVALSALGCSRGDSGAAVDATGPDGTYVATSEPAGAVPVGEARQSAKDQDEVVLVGLIGGSAEPFVEGIAAFTIVDPKVPFCADDEGCPTPWDYCCEQNQVKENIATVQVVGADGQPIVRDARQLLGVKELNTVVVQGKAQRDSEGNLAVLATQVFVRE